MNSVGPYEITGELGAGGMGVVYRARREGADSDVALKVIAAGEDASTEAIARFQREARIATELDHPGIVKVLETGFDDEPRLGAEASGEAGRRRLWFAMELIEGEPLSKLIKEREFTWQEAVTIVRDVADALSVAHERGVLHRDIKPSNILMDGDGKPHLTDFGLAKDTRTESKYTRTGQTLGTPAYMAPEQARGDLAELTPASDVWALGCVLYELLANRPAFEGDTPAAIVGAVIGGHRKQIPAAALGVPRGVIALVDGALDAVPGRRPRNAAEFAEDCARVLAGGRPRHGRPRRGSVPVVLAVAVLVVGTAAGVSMLWGSSVPGRGDSPAVRTSGGEAARPLVVQAWALRTSDPEACETLLRRAASRFPEQFGSRLQLGLFLWMRGEVNVARDAWMAIPSSAPEYRAGQLYLGLSHALSVDTLGQFDAAAGEPFLARVRDGSDRIATLARSTTALMEDRPAGVANALATVPGWEAAYLRGQAAYAAVPRDRRTADRELTRGLEEGVPFVWAYLHRSQLRAEMGDLEGGLRDAETVIRIRPKFHLGLLNRALRRMDLRNLQGAEQDIKAAIDLHPTVEAFLTRAHLRRLRGDESGALLDLDAVLRARPRYSDALFNRGNCHLRAGRLDDAERDYRAVIAVGERPAMGQANLGAVLLQRAQAARAAGDAGAAEEQEAEAVRLLDAALARDPGLVIAISNRAGLHGMRGEYDAGLQLVRRALDIVRDDPHSLTIESKLLFWADRAAEALKPATQAVNVDPGDVRARRQLASVLLRLGRLEAAAEEWARILEHYGGLAEDYYSAGLTQQRLGRGRTAVTYYDGAIQRDPRHIRALVNRGVLRKMMKDMDGARADYDAALAIDSRFPNALTNRASLLMDLGEDEAALRDLELVLSDDPDNVTALVNRSGIWVAQRRYDRALQDATRAVELRPSMPEAWLMRGVAKHNLGRKREALQDYRESMRRGGSSWSGRASAESLSARLEREGIRDDD